MAEHQERDPYLREPGDDAGQGTPSKRLQIWAGVAVVVIAFGSFLVMHFIAPEGAGGGQDGDGQVQRETSPRVSELEEEVKRQRRQIERMESDGPESMEKPKDSGSKTNQSGDARTGQGGQGPPTPQSRDEVPFPEFSGQSPQQKRREIRAEARASSIIALEADQRRRSGTGRADGATGRGRKASGAGGVFPGPQELQAQADRVADRNQTNGTGGGPNLGEMMGQLAGQGGSSGQGGQQGNQKSRSEQQNQFLEQTAEEGREGEKPIRVEPAREGPVLFPGTVIPAVLETKISTGLPGEIRARVTRTVYDSKGSGTPIIPKGTVINGKYDSKVFNGQARVLSAFQTLRYPDGRRVHIGGMQGVGDQGAAGMAGDVDNHFWEMLGASILTATLTEGVESIGGNQRQVYNFGGGGTSSGSSGGRVIVDNSTEVLEPYTDQDPTIEIPPGETFRIMVNRPIKLPGPGKDGEGGR